MTTTPPRPLLALALAAALGPACDLLDDPDLTSGVDVGDDCPYALPIEVNTVTPGRLDAVADWDFFEVTVTGGGTLHAFTTGSIDTLGAILDESCADLVIDDDGGEGLNFDASVTVPAGGGTYYVVVTGATDDVVGDYDLTVGFGASTGGGAAPPNCSVSFRIVGDMDSESGPWERDEDRLAFCHDGTWTGSSYACAEFNMSVWLTVSPDRSRLTSFSATSANDAAYWEIDGGNLPVVYDSATLSTLKAEARGLAACDAITRFEFPNQDPDEDLAWLTGFHCDANSYVEVYCD